MELRLKEILNIRSLNAVFAGSERMLLREITGVSIDSRRIQVGELFFAIAGNTYDAHDFVSDAIQSGAVAAVVDKKWHQHADIRGNFILVDDTVKALQTVSQSYRIKFQFPFIAVTGSNGKTTSKEMIVAVLSNQFTVLKNQGNLNNHIGVPLTLFELNPEHNMAVIEMGTNHYQEIMTLADIARPSHGLITNIGAAHLQFFGSLEGVAKAKTELWHYLEENDGAAFVNNDDPFLSRMPPSTKKVITYGFDHPSDVRGEYLGMDDWGFPGFRVSGVTIRLRIAGEHNVHNALSAVAIGLEFGIGIEQIRTALETFSPASKRMEIIREGNFTIINDCYNSNPSSAERALTTLAHMRTTGQRIAILADMLELGETGERLHQGIGENVAGLPIDHLLTYGPLSKCTADAANRNGVKRAHHFESKASLLESLKDIICDGDLILIKGSRGMAMEEVTEAIVSLLKSSN